MPASDNYAVELGERVIASMYEENVGNKFVRQHRIAERAIEAKFQAAEKPVEICKFRNSYGWCKLDDGHKGSHTVIQLGNDDEVYSEEEQKYSTGRRVSLDVWLARLGNPDHDPDREV